MPASALEEQTALSCSRFCRGRDVRRQASQFISTFSIVPTQKTGWGTLSTVGQRLSTFHVHQTPPGKDGGTGSYWESLIQGVWMAQSLHF